MTLAPAPERLVVTTTSHRVPSTERWSSTRAFVLAAAGSAIGLGDVWLFPSLAGTQGGGAFVLVYLAAVALVGVPVLMAELVIGRRGGAEPVAAMSRLAVAAGRVRSWRLVAVLGLGAGLLALSFYAIVAGWAVGFLVDAASGRLAGDEAAAPALWRFGDLLASPLRMAALQTLFLAASAAVVALGVRRGLERANRVGVPILVLILLVLVAHGATRGAAFGEAVRFLLQPAPESFGWRAVLHAVGYACFTLSVGIGAMLTYGAYLPRDAAIPRAALGVAGLDTAVSLLAALAVFPVVFAHGMRPTQGAGLVFVSLPMAFSAIPGGRVLATLFFAFLVLAALTSAISVLEPLVRVAMRRLRLERRVATILCGALVWLLGLAWVPALSAGARVLGRPLLDVLVLGTTAVLLPLAALGFALFVGWALPAAGVRAAIGGGRTPFRVWHFLLRWVAPVAIGVGLVAGVLGR